MLRTDRPRPFGFVLALVLVLGGVSATEITAQGIPSGGGGKGDRIEGSFKFLPIPYINYDRSIGLQGGALPMALFNPVKRDTLSPSSMAGLFGMYSTNKTWFVFGFTRLHLFEDDWRVSLAGGTGTYNFQFFLDSPISGWIPYRTEMDIAFARVQRRIYRRLYGGVSYVYLDFKTTVDSLPGADETNLHGLGLNLALDHRSSVFYPRTGFENEFKFFTYPGQSDEDNGSSKIELEHNHFVSLRQDQDVLAARLFAGAGIGNLSFNQQFVVGRDSDLRGYTQGAFRGNYLVALQGEYRWNFKPRLGAVGFAGVATVFDAVNESDNGRLLPGIGTGFRYVVDTETGFRIGADFAVGRDDWGLYFRIGEAF
jgi:outer membrane protein assembly factor BamA